MLGVTEFPVYFYEVRPRYLTPQNGLVFIEFISSLALPFESVL